MPHFHSLSLWHKESVGERFTIQHLLCLFLTIQHLPRVDPAGKYALDTVSSMSVSVVLKCNSSAVLSSVTHLVDTGAPLKLMKVRTPGATALRVQFTVLCYAPPIFRLLQAV